MTYKRTFIPAIQFDDNITFVLVYNPVLKQRMWHNPANPSEALREMGMYEPNIRAYLQEFLKDDDVFFDIGAAFGDHSLWAKKHVGSAGIVVSFEPDPRTRLILEENIGLSGKDINIMPFAIGDRTEKAKLHLAPSMGTSFVSTGSGRIEDINLITLDDFCAKYKWQPNVIKIDTEGYEMKVLQGGVKTLTMAERVIIEPHPARLNGVSSHKCVEFLKDCGFTEFYTAVYKDNGLEKKEIDNPHCHVFAE